MSCELRPGELVLAAYRVEKKIGAGHFSTVFQVSDADTGRRCALKAIKSKEVYMEQGRDEVAFLKRAREINSNYIVKLLGHFTLRLSSGAHLCLLLEKLDCSLLSFIESRPRPLENIKSIARDVLQGLADLQKIRLVHTDLKPENILLHNGGRSAKIADLGNSCYEDKQFTQYIQTTQYRSPEVILKLGYSCRTDLWSFGCVLYEMVTGRYLFRPRSKAPPRGFSAEEDHLALMVEVLGPLPAGYARGSPLYAEYFDRDGALRRIKDLEPRRIRDMLLWSRDVREVLGGGGAEIEAEKAEELEDFLQGMLRFRPADRKAPEELLAHPWLAGGRARREQ